MNARTTALLVVLAAAAAGCTTLESQYGIEPPRAAVREEADADRIARLEERLRTLEMEYSRLQKEIEDLYRSLQDAATATRTQAQDLERRLHASDAARDADRKSIVDELTRKITVLWSSLSSGAGSTSAGSARGPGGGAEYGREHVVKPGETLSAIAAAYKCPIDRIIKANNLKSADALRVGQKIFIPD